MNVRTDFKNKALDLTPTRPRVQISRTINQENNLIRFNKKMAQYKSNIKLRDIQINKLKHLNNKDYNKIELVKFQVQELEEERKRNG